MFINRIIANPYTQYSPKFLIHVMSLRFRHFNAANFYLYREKQNELFMLYYPLKYLCRIGFRFFFRKIYFSNREAIPDDKPVILAVNHPTAFLDPVLIATFVRPGVHFIVRGDIFNSRLVRAILASLKMHPIFRFRDGFSNLKNNQGTMEICYELLRRKQNILILAEGQTIHEKRLRPIQKGAARMAFDTIERFGEMDIQVIPIGVNFTDALRFRSEVMLEVGEAIPVKNFVAAYRENPRKGISDLTHAIATGLRQHVIHVADQEDDEWVDQLLAIRRNDLEKSVLPIRSSSAALLQAEFASVEFINKMQQPEKQQLRAALEDYRSALAEHRINDVGVAHPQNYRLAKTIFVILGFIPFILGKAVNAIPMALAKYIADNYVRTVEFYSSIRFGVMVAGYFILGLAFLIAALFVKKIIFTAFVIAAPFFGFFSLLYEEIFMKWNAARRFKALPGELRKSLEGKRARVVEMFVVHGL